MESKIPSVDTIVRILDELRDSPRTPIDHPAQQVESRRNREDGFSGGSDTKSQPRKTQRKTQPNSPSPKDPIESSSDSAALQPEQVARPQPVQATTPPKSSQNIPDKERARRKRANVIPGGFVRYILPKNDIEWLIEGYGIKEGTPIVAVRYNGKETRVTPTRVIRRDDDGYTLATYKRTRRWP